MSMPEAAVDENDGFIFGQDDVGLPWQFFVLRAIDGKAVASLLNQGAHDQLGLGVFTLDLSHVPAAFFRCQMISHSLPHLRNCVPGSKRERQCGW